MFGLRAANFKLYPQKFAYLFAGRTQALMVRVFTSDWLNSLVVPSLCFLTLAAVDQLHDFLVVPAVLWFPLTTSATFVRQQLLLSPLWLTHTFKYFAAFAFLFSLSFSYQAFADKLEFHRVSQGISNVQR